MSFGWRAPASTIPCFAIAVVLVAACARDQEPPQSGFQAGQTYPQGGQGAYVPGQGGVAPGYGQAGTPGVTPIAGYGGAPAAGGQPTTVPTGTAGSGTAQPIDPGAASMVQPVINELAKAHTVAGSKPLGSALVGNFNTGQTLETTIQLQPNKCYTVVGTSLPPVSELNVQIVAATPLPNVMPVLAADSDTGPTAVVGRKPNCYKWAFPVPAAVKVVLQVTGGTGLAAAQVYEK